MVEVRANGCVAVITGASSGLGKSFAKALLLRHYTVYACARRIELMKDLEELGAIIVSMDITDAESIDLGVKKIQEKHDSVDVLINNAGFALFGAMEDINIADARYQFEVNLFGLAQLTQQLLPAMRRKRSGRIINISSMAGRMYTPLGCWYHASKYALEAWSDCLRLELYQFNIPVVIIEPGIIKTGFDEVMLKNLDKSSEGGFYYSLVRAVILATKKTYRPGFASNPSVITNCLIKAIKSSKPKTRYTAGKYAKLYIHARKWLGDRLFDRLLRSKVGF